VTLDQIIAEAEKCRRCGKPHQYRQVDTYRYSWADPDDGHTYVRTQPPDVVDWLRSLAARGYSIRSTP
jgi:hypothetical protein